MFDNSIPFFDTINLPFIITSFVTVIIFLYAIFALILFNKTRTLGRIVYIETSAESMLQTALAFLHLVASLLLFIFAIGILVA